MLSSVTVTSLNDEKAGYPSFEVSLAPKFVKVEAESKGILHKFAMAYRMFGIAGSVFLAVDVENYNYKYTLDNLDDGRVQISYADTVNIKFKAEPLTKEEFEKLTGSSQYIYGEPVPIS